MLIRIASFMGMKGLVGKNPREVRSVFILMVMSVFFIADTMLIGPNVNNIMAEFGKTEDQVGLVSTVFIFLGAFIALVWGYMADKYRRKNLVLVTIVLGEIPCLLTGYVRTYEELLAVRALTGLGIGGLMPLIFSMVGDLVPDDERPAASAWLGLAEGMGLAAGQLLAGHLGDSGISFLGAAGWRLPFILAALPNLALAPLFMLLTTEPPRGGGESAIRRELDTGLTYDRRIQLGDYVKILKNRTNLYFILQALPGTVGWGVLPYWMVTYFVVEKNVAKPLATNLSIIIGGFMIIGGFAGGLAGNKIHNIDKRYLPYFCGVTTLIGMGLFLIMFGIDFPADPDFSQLTPVAISGMAAGFFVTITSANVKAIVLNVNPPENRGAMMSIFTLADSFGKGSGPLLGGIFIVHFGYANTMNLATASWLLCGLVFIFLMTPQYPRDVDALAGLMEERAAEMESAALEAKPPDGGP